MYTESEVLDFVKEEDVKFIRLAFFDMKGKQKNISIMADQLNRAFEMGISFDASAIEGFEAPNKSDLFLHPDPTTLSVLPWRPNTGKVCRMFCNIKYADGTPYKKDCRNILKKVTKQLKDECNVTLSFGPEVDLDFSKMIYYKENIADKKIENDWNNVLKPVKDELEDSKRGLKAKKLLRK